MRKMILMAIATYVWKRYFAPNTARAPRRTGGTGRDKTSHYSGAHNQGAPSHNAVASSDH